MPPAVYPILRSTTPQADPGLPHTLAISDVNDLQDMSLDRAGNYYLTQDIDASETSGWNAGAGFIPIGTAAAKFTGTLDGNGHTITGLVCNRQATSNQSLLGYGSGCKVANLLLVGVNIIGGNNSGALFGSLYATATIESLVQNCHSSGTVRPNTGTYSWYGGLIGQTVGHDASGNRVKVYDCSSAVAIDTTLGTQHWLIGGLIGETWRTHVRNCSASGNVGNAASGRESIGGFVGKAQSTNNTIEYCSASGDVAGDHAIGGFIGWHGEIISGIFKCSAAGDVEGLDQEIGGFAGYGSGHNYDCYAWGNVTGGGAAFEIGGFVGQGISEGNVYSNCYSKGLIAGGSGLTKGGFGGGGGGNGTGTFWDRESSGMVISDGDFEETSKTTKQMGKKNNFPTYDFNSVWIMPASGYQIILGKRRTGQPIQAGHTANRNIFG